jgi:hypothetical protein
MHVEKSEATQNLTSDVELCSKLTDHVRSPAHSALVGPPRFSFLSKLFKIKKERRKERKGALLERPDCVFFNTDGPNTWQGGRQPEEPGRTCYTRYGKCVTCQSLPKF